MRLVLPLLVMLLALPACGGGGGGGSPEPSASPRIIVVNRVPGQTVLFFDIEAYELGNILNEFSEFETAISVAENKAVVLDQGLAGAFLTSIPTLAELEVGMAFVLPVADLGDLALGFPQWAPGEGTLVLEAFVNPDFPDPDELEFEVRRITVLAYEALLAGGEIQEVSP